jgi:hypothetical protein
MMKVGQAIYAQPNAETWAEKKPDDGVVDAEEDKGEEKDEKKNERV